MAAGILGRHLAASRVAYVEFNGDEYVIKRDYVDGIPSMSGRYPAASFGSGKISDYLAGETRVVRDTRTDVHNAPSDNANFAAHHVHAGIGVPLIKRGAFVAALVVHMNVPRDWGPKEVALVEQIAEQTWQAVERTRAEAASRESEVRLAAAFATVPVGLAVIDIDGKVTTANEKYLRFLPRGVITAPAQFGWERGLSEQQEQAVAFSPWHGLAAHQPIGGVNRARKSTYEKSVQAAASATAVRFTSFVPSPMSQPKA